MKTKVGVFSATRAEYGLLYNVMKEILKNEELILQTFISGTHLSKDYGETYKDIIQDGFDITSLIEMDLSNDTVSGMAVAMSDCLINMTEEIVKHEPDILIILGDRYESFMAAQAALITKTPVAHIHGGEITEGAMDESFRHSISKMSQFHFVAADEFKKRVIQLGENPNNIWVTGAVGIDNIDNISFIDKNSLEHSLSIDIEKPLFLMTYHPVTLNHQDDITELKNILSVLENYNGTLIITGVNADPGRSLINDLYAKYISKKQKTLSIHLFKNLGFKKYLSLMSITDIVIGNSSSGIIEAPALGTPSLDIGDRQKGRPRSSSVLHSNGDKKNIRDKVELALSSDHKNISNQLNTLYKRGGVAKKIVQIIATLPLKNSIRKKFYDL